MHNVSANTSPLGDLSAIFFFQVWARLFGAVARPLARTMGTRAQRVFSFIHMYAEVLGVPVLKFPP